MFLQKQEQFRNLIPVLSGFQTAKCLQHSIGKYLRSSGLEESLRQTCAFVRSLKRLLILLDAVKNLKWSAFNQTIKSDRITAFESSMRGL